MVQFCVSISPESVGAYRIRPDVGEQEMTATSILSLKACRKTQRGISRPGKCSPGTEQGFPAWGNVPRKPSKVFPLGKMFPWNRARFSHPGKCSPGTGQGFPCQFHYEQFLCWPNSFMWRAYAIRPYIFTICSLRAR